jgi:hypothetical protein
MVLDLRRKRLDAAGQFALQFRGQTFFGKIQQRFQPG